MRFNRRRFLSFIGLSSVSLVGVWHLLKNYVSRIGSLDPEPAIAASPQLSEFAKPVGTSRLRFVALADSGSGDRNQYAVGEAMARYHRQTTFSLAILAGDNIYTNGEMEKIGAVFEQPYRTVLQHGVKFHACLGNHDIRTANGELQLRYPGFNMQGRYYTFRQGPVQFFAIDTNGNAPWKAQLAWLQRELSRSDAPWKIVFGHHPIYSSGVYGSDRAMIQALTPLFKQYGVQLYINGHEHDYERTHIIDGTTYLITGIGGASLRRVGRSKWTAYSTSRFGFSALDVYDDRLQIQGIGADGRVFDRGIVPIHSA